MDQILAQIQMAGFVLKLKKNMVNNGVFVIALSKVIQLIKHFQYQIYQMPNLKDFQSALMKLMPNVRPFTFKIQVERRINVRRMRKKFVSV